MVALTALALYDLHKNWAWFVVIGNGVAGAWSLLAHRYTALRTRVLWWFIGVVEVAIFVQVAMGVALVKKYKYNFPKFHAFYGFVAIVAVAIIYSYRPQLKGKTYLLYGGGSLFLMGLGIRAMVLHN